MGKFPEADAELKNVKICLRCGARNNKKAKKCRKCGRSYFRPKRYEIRAKK